MDSNIRSRLLKENGESGCSKNKKGMFGKKWKREGSKGKSHPDNAETVGGGQEILKRKQN